MAFIYCLQTNGFSPEWVLIWSFRVSDTGKAFEHCLQENGFAPEWILIYYESLEIQLQNKSLSIFYKQMASLSNEFLYVSGALQID